MAWSHRCGVMGGLASADRRVIDELLAGCDSELKRLQGLLEDLSILYEQALGTLRVQPQRVDLNEWLATVVIPWRTAAQQKGLTWQVDLN